MRGIIRLLKPYRLQLAIISGLYIISTVCSLLMPYTMSQIVNNGVAEGDMHYIITRGQIMIALAVASLISALITVKINSQVSTSFATGLQKTVFNKINSLTFEEYSSIGTSSLLTRATEDIFILQEVANSVTYAIITVPIMFIGGVVLTWTKDWLLALIMLILSPLILFIVRFLTRQMGELWENADKYIDVQNKVMRERLSGLRVIRAFDKENHEHNKITRATEAMAKNIIKSNVLGGVINPLTMGLLNLGLVVMLYIGSLRIQTDSLLTAGDIIACVQYVALIMNGILLLSWTMAWLPHVKVSIRRVNEVLALKSDRREKNSKELLKGDVELQNVHFSYGDGEEEVLKDINISISEGEIVGIIGGTGSGKSTVAKLLMDFYAPKKGTITLGGRNYEALTREVIRDNISIAIQKSMVFKGTIEENLKMGRESAREEGLIEAAEIAQIHDFIVSQAEGFNYSLAQGGANLSGGQKQRINIARAIIKKAAVYIFDDSFSALDYLTESKLRKGLNQYLKGKTQIIITQRAATAMRCDKVYVMERGEIVGSGSHSELLESCSIYKEIYDSQLGGTL
ncbi:ABC transporter ATP-binding protein [Alloiococcus sp. CFN-8]|uniref:ABC transporter ATP-binding protein n=1 Tax=Alloiococcus sp. CFN-8 TaxID=3416081 RepID=UPI003CF9A726